MLKEILGLTVPVCFIYGEHDTIVPAHQGRAIAKLLGPKIACIEIPETGHSIVTGSRLGKTILEACTKVGTPAMETCCQLVNRIPDETLLSYRSYWSSTDTMNIINKLYDWLHELPHRLDLSHPFGVYDN